MSLLRVYRVQVSSLMLHLNYELPGLSLEDQQKVTQLLVKYREVFTSSEGDLGCTNLISHEIPLVNVLARQRYRRIPPSQYDAVNAHIKKLLDSQVI